jgi:outer membrane protein TolC
MGRAKNVTPSEGIPSNLIVNPTTADGTFGATPMANGLIKEGILRGSRAAGGRKNESYGLKDQHRFGAGIGWRLSLAAFGELRKAKAWEAHAVIEAEAHMYRVAADVVSATQASKANHELIGLAHQQVLAAEEALRLTEANLRVGTVTTLDVLQAQDAATQARLRYARSVVRYDQSQVNLLAALGLLDFDSLGLSLNEDDQQG